MSAINQRGKQSFILPNPPVITAWASVAGKKESEGPLSTYFDYTSQDTLFGQKTWEQAEEKMQQLVLETLVEPMHRFIFQFEQNQNPPSWSLRRMFYHG